MEDRVFQHTPDFIFHLGDYADDAQELRNIFPRIPFASVKGNCDFYSDEPTDLLLTLEDTKLFLTHGHRYGVKMDLLRLKYSAIEQGARIALFGHTHCPFFSDQDGVILFNPGSVRDGAHYGLIEISKGIVQCHLLQG